MKNLDEMINDVEDELKRVKDFINHNNYHNGTAISRIVRNYRNYRNDLKKLLTVMISDRQDGVENYGDIE